MILLINSFLFVCFILVFVFVICFIILCHSLSLSVGCQFQTQAVAMDFPCFDLLYVMCVCDMV